MSNLPGILAEIAAIAGEDAALQIARAKGGMIAYVPLPTNLRAGHWLAEAVGLHKGRLIAERFGGGACEIPIAGAGNRAQTHAAIRRAIDDGLSTQKIAHLVGVSLNTVKRHRAAIKRDAADRSRSPRRS